MEPSATLRLDIPINSLPYSKMVYPSAPTERLKYAFWRFYTPVHPYLRNTLLAVRAVSHDIRQPFHIGRLAPGRSVEDFVAFLIGQGYGNHFVAWKDKGEILGLRRTDGFARQYHIRLFEDGEIRGHYEYTPECYPMLHFKGIGQEDRSREFKELLGGWIA